MPESLIEYRSLRFELLLTLVLAITIFIGGFLIGQISLPVTEVNLVIVIFIFSSLPLLAIFLGLYIGWRTKSNLVTYNPPEWQYQPLGLSPDDCSKLIKNHNRKYIKAIGYSNYWFFLLPPILAIIALAFPLYSYFEDTSIQTIIPNTFASILLTNYLLSEYGGFRASFNAASEDFTLPLIREAIQLAKTQSKIVGISKIHVVLDHASEDDFNVYRNPRVVARVVGTENDAYIESRTEDIGAIDRLLIYLNLSSESKRIVWWWQSRDRNFRKYEGANDEGYYVQAPVPSLVQELGVKDVNLVTENAIAILLLEWMRIHGTNSELDDILGKLGVNTK
jgi:hypothetical protein